MGGGEEKEERKKEKMSLYGERRGGRKTKRKGVDLSFVGNGINLCLQAQFPLFMSLVLKRIPYYGT